MLLNGNVPWAHLKARPAIALSIAYKSTVCICCIYMLFIYTVLQGYKEFACASCDNASSVGPPVAFSYVNLEGRMCLYLKPVTLVE